MAFSTQVIGTTFANTAADDSAKYALGTRSLASDGSEWIYVKSGAAITGYDTVHINSSFVANSITAALAITAGDVGFMAANLSCSTSGQYFWAMVRGNPTLRVLTACQPAVPLYTTDTAGVLDDATASASHYQVMGTMLDTSNVGSTASGIAGVANFPMIRRPAA
tara:strand:+ start:543 stop:1037 length:495 start_codon:yes stop_codon:yes gene_type:complete